MHTFKVISAVAALSVGLVSASSCQSLKITSANQAISCDIVKGDVTVDKSVAGELVIEGPKQIMGNLIIKGAANLVSVSSSSINAIGGTLQLTQLNLLSTLTMTSLRSVNSLTLSQLPQLGTFMFGSEGVTKVDKVSITDTFISNLDGLNLATVDTFTITDNKQLTSFNSDLVNVTNSLIISFNGNNFAIKMNKLETAKSIQLRNIKSFSAPNLQEIDGSLAFNLNSRLSSYSAPKLTTVKQDISFYNNTNLSNITFPKLTSIGGALSVINNTAMKTMEGFPKLTKVGGAILMTGEFEKVALPSLNAVQGSATVYSTTDIDSFCNYFNKLGSDKVIKGEEHCKSNYQSKGSSTGSGNSGDSGDSDSSGNSSGDSSDNSDGDSLAALNHVNFALLGLAGVAALAQLM